jgi:Fungal Zn(2)-Cys(6) binuclear cluster domain
MSDRIIDRARSQHAQPTRGPDRCDKCKYVLRLATNWEMMLIYYRAQHARCDGTRPVCRRCHRRGNTCIYAPKRSPWTVYTDAVQESGGQTGHASISSNATPAPESHTKSMPNANIAPGSAMLALISRPSTLQHARSKEVDIYSSDQLHLSLDAVPSRSNWSNIRVDVHALMNHCKVYT